MSEEDRNQKGNPSNNNDNNASDEEQAAKEARAEKVRQRKEEMRLKAESNASSSSSSNDSSNNGNNNNSSSQQQSSQQQQQSAPAPAKLREDLVASSVNFLNHPKVKPSPLSQKTAFLQKKGLTQEEINEAFKRVGESFPADSQNNNNRNQSSPQNQQQQQQQYYPPPAPYNPQNQQVYRPAQQLPPPPPPSWYQTGSGLALIALGCAGLGAGVTALAQVVLPYLTGENVTKEEKRRRKRAEEDEKKANDSKMMAEMMNSIKALQEKNDSLQENLRNVLQQQNERQRESTPVEPMSKNDKARLSETEAELKRLRAMLVDKNVSSSLSTSQSWAPQANSKPSLPAWQMASSTPKVDEPSSPSPRKDTEKEEREEPRVEELPEEKESAQAASSPEQPANSSKFEEIMKMVKNGQVPDDVRNIDDKPRDTNTKIEKGTREAPQKPWERRNDSN